VRSKSRSHHDQTFERVTAVGEDIHVYDWASKHLVINAIILSTASQFSSFLADTHYRNLQKDDV